MCVLVAGCGNAKDDFVAARVLDRCNQSLPVCNSLANCLLGEESYISGRFPGEGKVIIQTASPSTVTVSFLFQDITAAGDITSIVFNETGCKSNTRIEVAGQTVTQESTLTGVFKRSADLQEAGDHLIDFQSGTEATYTMKVDVTPKAP